MSELDGKVRSLSLLELLRSRCRGEKPEKPDKFLGFEWEFARDFDGVNADISARGGGFEASLPDSGDVTGVVLTPKSEDPPEWEAVCTAETSFDHRHRATVSDEDPYEALDAALRELASDLDDQRSVLEEAHDAVASWSRCVSKAVATRPEDRLRAIGAELLANAQARQGTAIVSAGRLMELFAGFVPE